MIQSVWKNLTGLQKAAEHLWCDFKWAKNSSSNTNDFTFIIWKKSTGHPLLYKRKRHFVPQQIVFQIVFPPLLHSFEVSKHEHVPCVF